MTKRKFGWIFNYNNSVKNQYGQSIIYNTKGAHIVHICTVFSFVAVDCSNTLGSPIWNCHAGLDILPSPPWENAKTLKKYVLPGVKSSMTASSLLPIYTTVLLATLISLSDSQYRTLYPVRGSSKTLGAT